MPRHAERYTTTLTRGEIEYTLDVRIDFTPGDPGCRYTPNGDGWPPTPPETEVSDVRVISAYDTVQETALDLLAQLELTDDEIETIGARWLETAQDRESCAQFDTREEERDCNA